MKRLRDEVYVNPQFKRPFGSSSLGESYGPSQTHAPRSGGVVVGVGAGGGSGRGTTQKLTTNDALTYLKEVKDMFQEEREKYDRFLDVMKDFKSQRIDTAGVIARVKELFKGHSNLILGFNTFLPKGYEITLTDEEVVLPKKSVDFDEAICFVNKIKKRFQNDDHVHKSFLDILNMYRKEHKGITEVYQEVEALFDDHPDLLEEFSRFLPDSLATASAANASFCHNSFHPYDEKTSAIPTMKQYNTEKEQKKRAEKENRDGRNLYQDDREPDSGNNGDISMLRLSDRRKSTRKVEDLGGNSNFASNDDKDAWKSMYLQEFTFCEKVKDRLHSEDDYQAFLKCLHIYSTEIITRKELQSLVADLVGKYPDLMDGFNEFLERCEQIDGFLAGVMGKKTLWGEGHSSKALKLEDSEQKREVHGGKEKDRCSLKYWGKSIQELDLSNCQRCTPSYRLLPEDYPITSASQRSELGAQVLNDHWVSVTSGSEDYSFKHMRRNQYEEILFRCEDDRFELDMLLESVSSTAKRAEELLSSINNNSIGSDSPIRIEDHFTVINLRCIERIYGDHGLDVMEILRKNPSLALPVILSRLMQKQDEWTKCCSDFNKVWAEIYAKNHYKSLDHRTFYFKQQDSKKLGTKSFTAEIKEIKEKMPREDDVLLSIAAGSRRSIVPNLEYEYADAQIHEDVYKLIKYSCEEVCSTKEQLNKVLRLWTTFLEPMLGIHSRTCDSDANKDDSASKCQTVRNTATVINGSDGSPIADAATINMKLQKPSCSGDSSTLPRVNSTRTGFTTVDVMTKEDGLTVATGERLTNSDAAATIGANENKGKINMEITSGHNAKSSLVNNGPSEEGHGAKLNTEDILSSEDGEASRVNESANGAFAAVCKRDGHNQDVDLWKNEKEEGELSPNGDLEDKFVAYQDGSSKKNLNKNHGDNGIQYCKLEICLDAAGKNDTDADDDIENVSESGEDVSGSESAANECSREGHLDEEDGEHDELERKAKNEGEVENMSEAHCIGGDGVLLPQSDRFLLTCKPLSKHVASASLVDDKKDRRVFYGNETFYVLFRLHQMLYERILLAKVNSASTESKWRISKDAISDPYVRFMDSLYSLLDGSSDNSKFEEECRSLIGNQSYVLFTLDKLIYKLVKQLQTVSSEEVGCKLLHLYVYEKSRKCEKYVDSVYYEDVHVVLHDENIYRFECASPSTRLSIQLMNDGNEKSEVVAVSMDPNFANYLNNDYLSAVCDRNVEELSAIMLKRNMRKFANLHESIENVAIENVVVMNDLECKMASNSSKISYVLDTEDFFMRLGRRRNRSGGRSSCNGQARVHRFHQFLSTSIQ